MPFFYEVSKEIFIQQVLFASSPNFRKKGGHMLTILDGRMLFGPWRVVSGCGHGQIVETMRVGCCLVVLAPNAIWNIHGSSGQH